MKKLFWLIILFAPHVSFAQPKNVIIVVGSGMGYNHIQATQNFTGTVAPYNEFPQQAGIYTLPAISQKITEPKALRNFDSYYHSSEAWSKLSYIDSSAIDFASAGTALATGRPTGTGALGYGIDSAELVSIISTIKLQGKSLGIVTNTAVTNSLASAFFAKAMHASDKASIAEQLASSTVDFVICSGHPEYDSTGAKMTLPDYTMWGGESAWDMVKDSYDIKDVENIAQATPVDISTKKYLGVSHYADFTDSDNKSFFATHIPFALNSLSANGNGFTAIVESRQIEYASRQGDKENVIAQMIAFNTAVDSVINWIETNSSWDETALLVLGSYESGLLADTIFTRESGSLSGLSKLGDNPVKGEYNFTLNSTQNTKGLTPFFAKGAGTDELKYYTDQVDYYREEFTSLPEIGRIIRELHKKTQYSRPQNIILVIADGCGRNHIKATKYFYGVTPVFESFPVQSFVSTYPGRNTEAKNLGAYCLSYSSDRAWGDKSFLHGYNNVTCSASSGLAMASGKKTYYYGMGLDLNFNAINTIAQYAKAIGKSSGLITTEPLNDATPSIFASHNISRNNKEQISLEMLIESELDVLIGTGHPEYTNDAELATIPNYSVFGGKDTWDALSKGMVTLPTKSNSGWSTVQDVNGDGKPDAWKLVSAKDDFSKIDENTSITRLLGVPRVGRTLQQTRSGDVSVVNPDNLNDVPHLATLALAGLNVLNKNNNGFFTMIEAGAIDQASHGNMAGRLLEETHDFFMTVDSIVAWIERNGGWDKNLLIVTADHETGLLTGEPIANDSVWKFHPIKDNGPGVMPGMVFNHKDHSNQLVNLYAKGAGAEIFNEYADEYDFFLGSYLTNSEIGEAMYKLWDGTPATIRNRPPFVVTRIPNLNVTVGTEFSFVIPQSSFGDSDDAELVFDVQVSKYDSLWLKYNKETSTLWGTPFNDGFTSVTVNAYDGLTTGAGLKITTKFNVLVSESTQTTEQTQTSAVYPNPVKSQQTLSFTTECQKVRMTNMSGMLIFETSQPATDNSIEIGSLPKGAYVLEFIGQTREFKTIIIE